MVDSSKMMSRRVFAARCVAGLAFPTFFPQRGNAGFAPALPGTQKTRPWMVSTMTGFVRCDSLGRTLMHEHILWFGGPRLEDSGYTPIPDDKRAESVDFAVSLLNAAGQVGIETLVDLTPHRPIDLYQQIAQQTRVRIVPSSGFYRRAKIPKQWAEIEDENKMEELMLREVTEGIGGTKIRAGIIKIASEGSPLTEWERKVFRAAARVQKATRIPIATHDGSGPREQFDLLVTSGATPRRVFLSHVDMGLHAKRTREQLVAELTSIARDGGYMEFDTFGQETYTPWKDLVFLWRSIIDAGFINRMFFSMDCNWRWENGKKILKAPTDRMPIPMPGDGLTPI